MNKPQTLLGALALLAALVAAPLAYASDTSAADESSAELWVAPPPAAAALAAARAQTRPWRFAVALPAGLDPARAGHWSEEGAERVWRMRLHSPGADSLSLHFDRWAVPAGTALWLHEPVSGQRQGPYGADHNARGQLWTALLPGDTVDVELRLPRQAPAPQIRLASLQHGFRSADAQQGFATKAAGDCNIDVACPEAADYSEEVRATVLIQFNGGSTCSGQLVNNTAQDFDPLLLTAAHCGIDASNADSVIAYFNYQRSQCERGGNRSEFAPDFQQSISGVEWLASLSESDFTLLRLGSSAEPAVIPPEWRAYWAGWTRRETAAARGASIHHPRGDPKSIALFSSPLEAMLVCSTDSAIQERPSTCPNAQVPNGEWVDVWRVVWSQGTTEPGSSGGAIYAEDGLIRGMLFGGSASCGSQSAPDYYGRFSSSWDCAPEDFRQLRPWLDPQGLNPEALFGRSQFSGAAGVVNPGTTTNFANCPPISGAEPPPTPPPTSPPPLGGGGSSGSGAPGWGWLALLAVTVLSRRRVAMRR